MNTVCLIGRLARDPDVRYANKNNGEQMCVARYTLAVDRAGAREGQQSADFIQCAAFGKNGEFVEKYLKKGMKIGLRGQIQTGSYTNKDGNKVYTFEVLADHHEFCERKQDGSGYTQQTQPQTKEQQQQQTYSQSGFMSIPDEVVDNGLPFN